MESSDSAGSIAALNEQAGCPERYQIKGLLGQGGMGMVYQAWDKILSRNVAIKIYFQEGAQDSNAQERFLREAKTLSLLDHPSIVHVFSSGLNKHGSPYHVMEFLQGVTLQEELENGPLNPSIFFLLFGQVLSGIDHAHQNQIIHRDLKPSNIIRCTDDEGGLRYKIIDFGIARVESTDGEKDGRTLTRTGALLGSPLYASPEQCRGEKATPLSDIYSLGCIIYECVSGLPPIVGDSAVETMYMHMSPETKHESLVSQSKSQSSLKLAKLVDSCLEKMPENRPSSAAEILTELAEISASDTQALDLFSNRTLGAKKEAKYRVNRMIALGISILILVVGGTMFTLSKAGIGPFNAPRIDPGKELTLRRIEDAKSRVDRHRQLILDSKSRDRESRYLLSLLDLGREQLNLGTKESMLAAAKTYEEGLTHCLKSGPALLDRQVAFHVLLAKSRYLYGASEKDSSLFSQADRGFQTALDLVKNSNWDNEKKLDYRIDILLERASLRVLEHRFKEAADDFLKANDLYDRHPSNGIKINQIGTLDQKLDRHGPHRVSLGQAVGNRLIELEPNSDQEAAEMISLSNIIGFKLDKREFRTKADLKKLAKFSLSLLPRVNDEKLHIRTLKLVEETSE